MSNKWVAKISEGKFCHEKTQLVWGMGTQWGQIKNVLQWILRGLNDNCRIIWFFFTFFVNTMILKSKNVLLINVKCLHYNFNLSPLWGKGGSGYYNMQKINIFIFTHKTHIERLIWDVYSNSCHRLTWCRFMHRG